MKKFDNIYLMQNFKFWVFILVYLKNFLFAKISQSAQKAEGSLSVKEWMKVSERVNIFVLYMNSLSL